MANSWGNNGVSERLYLFGLQDAADVDCRHEFKRHVLLGRKAMINLDKHIKKQRHYFANKDPSSQSYGFTIVMYGYELDSKES